MKQESLNNLINDSLAIEAEAAKDAGALGYMARAMVQATIPHSAVKETSFKRINGDFTFQIIANPEIGLPYGTVPRLLLAWLSTEAVLTQSRELTLGDSLSQFMRELDMVPTGGRWGSITRLKTQSKRLFSSLIQCTYDSPDRTAIQNILITESADLWWQPSEPDQKSLFNSTVILSEAFYSEVVSNPVPVDLRALKALKKSPMALDIYCWLTYRMSYLSKPSNIPWESLQAQFGAGYPMTAQGKRDFKKRFLAQLKKVSLVYPDANVADGNNGLLLKPSKTHIPKL